MISHIPLPSLPGAAETWKTGESYTIIHHTRAHTEAKKNKNIFYSFFYRTTDGAWATKEIAMLSFISFDTQAGGIIRIYFQNVPYSTPVWSNALIYGYGLVLVIYEASIWSLAEGAVQVCGWERMCVCIAHTSSPTQTHQTHTYTHIGHKYTYTGSKQHKIILLQPYFMCDDLVFCLLVRVISLVCLCYSAGWHPLSIPATIPVQIFDGVHREKLRKYVCVLGVLCSPTPENTHTHTNSSQKSRCYTNFQREFPPYALCIL